jgi:hypothetical protein
VVAVVKCLKVLATCRKYGMRCLLSCNHYKDDGQGRVQYHDLKGYAVCVDKNG